MRARKALILGAIGVAAACTTVALVWSPQTRPLPPIIGLSAFERGGVLDDNGAEMCLVTLSIHNPNIRQPWGGGVLFVKNDGRPCEVKSGNQWSEVRLAWLAERLSASLNACELSPGEEQKTLLLLPGSAASCRIWLKYVGGRVSYRVRSAYLVQRLPLFIRSRIGFKVWRWAGFPEAVPRSDWREMNVEIPLPRKNPDLARHNTG